MLYERMTIINNLKTIFIDYTSKTVKIIDGKTIERKI